MNAERELLQETLIGCIQALIDVLAITNPVAFGRASRIKRIAMEFASMLGCEGYWQLEAACMLSQLGYLSLPVELVEKLYYGERLTPEEQVLADGVPQVASKLLGHICRLEPVLQILDAAANPNDQQLRALGDGTIGLGARILSLVLEYDALVTQGKTSDVALQAVRAKAGRYSEALLEKFAQYSGVGASTTASAEIREIPLQLVEPGMTIMHDLRTPLGMLLVPRGFEVSETFLQRLHNFGSGILAQKIQVRIPPRRPTKT
jgi:response regulator RpfG family c-di-GMP phosphodiesterase